MTEHNERGRFIWHELMTPNPAGARDFYSAALGWTIEGFDGGRSHAIITGPAGPLGGCSALSPSAVPRWIPFVTVEDADRALREAADLGAATVVEPTAIEGGGRYAVLTDPQGATIGVYSAADFGADHDPDRGEFSWHELATTDYRAAFEFYRALFGWESASEHDMGPMGIYLIFGRGGKQLGGIFNKDAAGAAGEPAWLSYIRVGDLSATVDKIKSARGSLLNGPMEVPGGDWIAQLMDPYGAAFALHTFAVDVKAEGKLAPAAEPSGASRESAEASAADKGASAADARPARSKARGGSKTTGAKAAKPSSPASEARGASTITDVWTAAEEPAVATSAAKKSSATTGKAAKAKTSKKKASKAKTSGGGTAKKKPGKKKPGKKKAAKKTAKKAAKRTAKKKPAKKKAGKKKAAKKTATKKAAQKKAGKKTAKKKAGRKKAGRKKAGKKKAGKKKPTKKSGGKKAGKKTGKKAGRKAARKKSKKARRR